MVKRKTYQFRKGSLIEVEEYHDGNYGAPGQRREKKSKPTEEQKKKWNHQEKVRRCRHRLLEYFEAGDIFATWTYKVEERPASMEEALKDFRDAMQRVRREFKKRGQVLRWIRNIEKGTRGAWHIHLVIKEIGDTASIIQKAWIHGGTYAEKIRQNNMYSEDMHELACYMTKDETTTEKKKDGSEGKPRIKEANYGTSQHMPLKEAKIKKLKRWKKEVKPPKGYYIMKCHEGINPATHFLYRRYTMVRCGREGDSDDEDAYLYSG